MVREQPGPYRFHFLLSARRGLVAKAPLQRSVLGVPCNILSLSTNEGLVCVSTALNSTISTITVTLIDSDAIKINTPPPRLTDVVF